MSTLPCERLLKDTSKVLTFHQESTFKMNNEHTRRMECMNSKRVVKKETRHQDRVCYCCRRKGRFAKEFVGTKKKSNTSVQY